MKSKFDEVLYINSPFRPGFGYFGKPTGLIGDRYKVSNWVGCRDLWHIISSDVSLFFFSHASNKGMNVAKFMQKVEDILNIHPRSKFGPTQRKSIMWIKPSRWWNIRAMRRSLFTILLRTSCNYSPSKDNFKEALFSDSYMTGTEYAVNRFFAGHTVYTGKKRGWYRVFGEEYPGKNEIDKLLIKPVN